jgi:hypothetical protein
MRSSKAATAAVVAGAVALASAAYGIGTQTGDGTAEAARDGDRPAEPRLVMRFDGLADQLGVDADELEDAMRDFHEQRRGELRRELRKGCANADGRFERHREDLAAFLAGRLGIDEDKVLEALPDPPAIGRHWRGGPPPIGPGMLPG